jgi:hypothetical protein
MPANAGAPLYIAGILLANGGAGRVARFNRPAAPGRASVDLRAAP